MKKILLLGLLVFNICLDAQTFDWARKGGGKHADMGSGIVMDANGNLYVAGSFMDSAVFSNTLLVAQPGPYNEDVFLAKYDPMGTLLWIKQGKGLGSDGGNGIAIDSTGIYIVGTSCGPTCSFDTITLTRTNPNGCWGFIAKYDFNGNVIWARKVDGVSAMSSIAYSGGALSVVGVFWNLITLQGKNTIVNLNTYNQYNDGIFVAKYDIDGELLWAKTAGSCVTAYQYNNMYKPFVAMDLSGNSYITGDFNGPIIFDSDTISNSNMSMYITKYDSLGNFLWVKQYSGNPHVEIRSIKVDNGGNIFTVGQFFTNITFQGVTLNCNYSDFFLAKMDNDGNMIWLKQGGATINASGYGLNILNNGNLVITGGFKGNMNFDSSSSVLSSSNGDLFVAEITSLGNVCWAIKSQSQAYSQPIGGLDITSDNYGNSFLTGYFTGPACFGDSTYYGQGNDMIVAKISSPKVTTVNENEGTFFFNIFPNPTKGIIVIKLFTSIKSDLFITIKNELGQPIFSEIKTHFSGDYFNTIDLSNYSQGIYFAEMRYGGLIKTKKIILSK